MDMFREFAGVRYEESADLWVAEVHSGGRRVFHGDYGDPEIAAAGREIAILVHKWEAVRNFPEEDLPQLCVRFSEGLKYSLKAQTKDWHQWVLNLGLQPDEFLRLAGLELPTARA
ncbi:hypothetical protein DAT35_07925 [Vitiosangium sp. GDMCC 1.1324]|nr:hypothetical protein DAT35_07925 [Vitiosangium sp. GDMCC 1.1324]